MTVLSAPPPHGAYTAEGRAERSRLRRMLAELREQARLTRGLAPELF
jgi:hypothetical protein